MSMFNRFKYLLEFCNTFKTNLETICNKQNGRKMIGHFFFSNALHHTTRTTIAIYCYSVSKEGHVNNKNGVSNLNIKIIYLKLNYISNCQRYPSFFTNPDNGTQSQTRCAPENLPCRTFPELCLDCDPFVQCCLQKSRLLLQKGVMFSLQHLKRNKTFKYGIPMLVSIILILYKRQ